MSCLGFELWNVVHYWNERYNYKITRHLPICMCVWCNQWTDMKCMTLKTTSNYFEISSEFLSTPLYYELVTNNNKYLLRWFWFFIILKRKVTPTQVRVLSVVDRNRKITIWYQFPSILYTFFYFFGMRRTWNVHRRDKIEIFLLFSGVIVKSDSSPCLKSW